MKQEMVLEVGARERQASAFAPASIDTTAGIVSATFATDTPVRTYNYQIGEFWEILGFEAGMVRMDRINTSAPILDNHRRYEKKLGIVHEAKVEGGKLVGKLRYDINGVEGKEAFRQVSEGITKSVSVGYRVYKYEFVEDRAGVPVYRAIDWEPTEVSNADIPADISASMRTETGTNKLIIKNKTPKMDIVEKTPAEIEAENKQRQLEEKQRTDAAVDAERTRVSEITTLAADHERDADFVRKHIDGKTTVDAVRAEILKDMKEKKPSIQVGQVQDGFKSEADRGRAMEEGILHRMDAHAFPLTAGTEQNPYKHRTLMDMCDEYLIRNKLDNSGSARQRVQRAMSFGAQQRVAGMSTSDFPNIFANVLGKVLRKDYNFNTGKWKEFCYKQDATRVGIAENSLQLGDFVQMKKVMEGAEYQRQSVSEAKESFTAYKYGSEFGITLEMIINDDLGAMLRLAQKAIQMAAHTEDLVVYSLLLANPTMGDSVAVFDAAHGNVGTTGVISATSIAELITKMRTQKGLNGKFINLNPKYILTGPANEFKLDQILNQSFVPTKASDVVPASVKSLKPIIVPQIEDYAYYLIADPSNVDTIRYGGVVGEPDFTVEEMMEIKTDSYIHHARKFFGASFTDYRGFAKNAGAAS